MKKVSTFLMRMLAGAGVVFILFLFVRLAIHFGQDPCVKAIRVSRAAGRAVMATGFLEVRDSMRIGSLVPGVIKRMIVEENELVKKGQLIAEIDDGKEDAEVRQTQAVWERAKAKLKYVEKFYQRQCILHERGHISDDAYQAALRDYEQAVADVAVGLGAYDKARIEFDNKSIKSPDDGLVISKVSREGETVTLASPATILYTIAKDIKEMAAKLRISETEVGRVKAGDGVVLYIAAYPDREVVGTISDVSRSPTIHQQEVSYIATVPIDNHEFLFNPGMTVEATITLAHRSSGKKKVEQAQVVKQEATTGSNAVDRSDQQR